MEAGTLMAAGAAALLVGSMVVFGKPKDGEDKPTKPEHKHRKKGK